MDGIIAREIVERGNYLSPLTIYLSSILTKSPDALNFYFLGNKYQKYFEWNIIWTLGLDLFSIDESYFCKAGACDIQAINYFVATKYVEALKEIASSPNQKVILMPLEASNVIGALAGIGEIAKETFAKDNNKSMGQA